MKAVSVTTIDPSSGRLFTSTMSIDIFKIVASSNGLPIAKVDYVDVQLHKDDNEDKPPYPYNIPNSVPLKKSDAVTYLVVVETTLGVFLGRKEILKFYGKKDFLDFINSNNRKIVDFSYVEND